LVLDVEEGGVHPSSVATLVSVGFGAVYELLFREGFEGALGLEVYSFEGAGCGEGPA
jgi:hypothetical protein